LDLNAAPYRYFLAVAETQSFSRAAERLHMSQPALSAGIKEFERRLGFALFSRSSRRVELTAQGKLFLGNARRMVSESEWANRAADAIRENPLLIGASLYTIVMADRHALTDRFMVEHPEVSMRISILSDQAIKTDLQQERLELGLVLEHEASGSRVSSVEAPHADALERFAVARRPVSILLPEEHPLAARPDLHLGAFEGEEVVMINRSHGVSLVEDIVDQFARHGIRAHRAPEGHALGVERYARIFRKPAVCLGWFPDQFPGERGAMVARRAAGLEVVTKLVLLRRRGTQRPGAARFWELAQRSGLAQA